MHGAVLAREGETAAAIAAGERLSRGARLAVEGLDFSHGEAAILRGVDVAVESGAVLALLGPSGCGKTTLLRLIAGLLAPAAGRIRIGEDLVVDVTPRRRGGGRSAGSGRVLPPERRNLGMVFQDYALWPHMTVGGNVAFPLEMRGVPAAERRRRVEAALERVGLGGFAGRSPGSLSGGQQQRVALARAIVAEPRLILFDEPLSNLDKELRDQLGAEIGLLVRELGLTAVYVTHDQGEAFGLADHVAVMVQGRILQHAAPERLVADPADPGVAEFLNLGAVLAGRAGEGRLALDGLDALAPADGPARAARGPGRLLLPRRALAPCGDGPLRGVVMTSVFRGDHYALAVRLDGRDAAGPLIPVSSGTRIPAGTSIGLAVDWQRLRWFPDLPAPA